MSSLVEAVRAGRLAEVLGQLDEMTDTERRACLPELKELRKELRKAPWNSAARRAYPALCTAGAACHTGAAASAAWLSGADMRWSRPAPAVLLQVLSDRDRQWLGDVAHRLAQRPVSSGVPYQLMAGLVRLAGCAVPTTEAYVQGWMEHIGELRQRGDTVLDRLRRDPNLRELVAALFETPDTGSRIEWQPDEGPDSWTHAIGELTREGRLDRAAVVDACLARLLRGGSTTDHRVFLRQLTCLDLTTDEQRDRSADWIALASDATATLAAHAQAVLGRLALDGELTDRRLAQVTEAVLFRPEKKLTRAQLVLLGKVLTRRPAAADEVLPSVGQAFGHEDPEVQERALKLVERHLGKAANPEVREELADAAKQLIPGLRERAAPLFGLEPPEPEVYEELLPPVPQPVRVPPAPESMAELVEEVGALLASADDGSASARDTFVFERALDGLVRRAHQDAEALGESLREALRPVINSRWWLNSGPEHAAQYFDDECHGLELILATLLGVVPTNTLAPRPRTDRCAHAVLSRPFQARLREIAYRMRTDPLPFLLATPTWSTGSLEPEELVARLSEYRRLGTRAGEADFAQALLRVRTGDPSRAKAAAVEAAALGTAEGTRLAHRLMAGEPAAPTVRRRTQGGTVVLDMGEVPEFQQEFPLQFRALGRPVVPVHEHRYCTLWHATAREHWLAILPGRRELVAARLLIDLAANTEWDGRNDDIPLTLLAEAEGEAGEAVHLCVAYGLGSRHREDRLAAVDALLVLAARGQLDAARLGGDLAELIACGAVKPVRLGDALRTAAATGAYATVWAILGHTLPALLAGLGGDGKAAPVRGLGDLLAIGAECAERSGARGDVLHLAEAAARRGSSQVVSQARRLHTALTARAA